jgi:hypothetical protein
VAAAVEADPEALHKECLADLSPNSHLVAAGVVAVNYAQEHGYSSCPNSSSATLVNPRPEVTNIVSH